ncbi:putative major capsid protein [Escherichia phage vB_EcoM_IME392]|nr:putative major capsid protein [Escherichia phage vB_EcoM_IME392]
MTKQNIVLSNVDEASADVMANAYFDKYSEQMDAYASNSILARVNESLSPFEMIAVGQTLDQYQGYQKYVNESMSGLASMGAIPAIALDVITASVGNSILPLICSIQPIPEEHGIVYYRQIKASQTSGGYNAGDVIRDPLSRDNPGEGTLGAQRRQQVIGTGNGTETNFAATLELYPVRPNMVFVNIPGVGNGQDDGNGKILGFGFDGTINYKTGAITIAAKAAVPNTAQVAVRFDVDVDLLDNLDKIQAGLISKDIRAEIWTLAADIGTFANFAFQNRFGRSAEDEVASDLSNEITNVLNVRAIKQIAAMAIGETIWDQTPPAGVSYAEHKLTLVDTFARAESVLHNNAGVGSVNRIICGRSAAAVFRGMPEFTPAGQSVGTSVSLYGFYDGVPVIRATGVIEDNAAYLICNPDGYFNCPLAYSPFMPLIVTDTIQNPNNPFRGTKAAGVWAGMTQLNPNLVTKLTFKLANFSGS